MAVLALIGSTALCAQERMSEEELQKAMAERIEKAAERMAKDFSLKDEAKNTFVATFVAYQKEMFATNQPRTQRSEQGEGATKPEDLSAEDATATASPYI